jgi:hypothetical protein
MFSAFLHFHHSAALSFLVPGQPAETLGLEGGVPYITTILQHARVRV